jgi:outer membrane protein TolC
MTARIAAAILAVTSGAGAHVAAQGASPRTFTLAQAIQYAGDQYPAIAAALEQVNASSSGVDVARAAYLPRLDSLWQSNRATANNVFGQLLPQSVLPSMSGPVLPSASSQSVWGSAAGALLSWEPVDFGLRRAGVAGAEAGLARARAGEALTRLDVQAAAGGAFLDVLAARQSVAAAQADVDRRTVLRRAVQTLVDNQLRPGAEASRAEAELAAARTRLIQAQQHAAVADVLLARALGISGGPVAPSGDELLSRTPPGDLPAATPAAHPLSQAREAAVDELRSQEAVLARTDYPRIYLQSSVLARGSGASASGVLDGGIDGLGLDRANWAAGVQVVFPNVFDFAALRARKAAAAASTRSQQALYDETVLAVSSEQQTTTALLQAARAVAESTPIQLEAARQSETQARARYDAGLASITEVADAQTLLAAAESQDRLARIAVWRALLEAAAARGDLAPFVALAGQP